MLAHTHEHEEAHAQAEMLKGTSSRRTMNVIVAVEDQGPDIAAFASVRSFRLGGFSLVPCRPGLLGESAAKAFR